MTAMPKPARPRAFPLWTLFALVLVVALIVGSGVLSGSAPTPQQRATAIESDLRCPSCEDLSVAQSSAPTAVTVRATVAQMVADGQTDQQIERYLVSRYGGSIVLDPPDQGVTLVVWLLPVLGGLAAATGLVVVMIRRRTVGPDPDPAVDRPSLDGQTVADRRWFLDRSLADADAEYLAGDLSDKDYLALRRRDMARLAALDAGAAPTTAAALSGGGVAVADPPMATAAPSPEPSGHRGEGGGTPAGRGRRRWLLAGAVTAFGAALVVSVSLFATNRLPGQTATGSINLNQSQQVEESLTQAATSQNQGKLDQAAQLYQSVLDAQPNNEVALAQLGWLEFETGQQSDERSVIDNGLAKLDRAVRLNPADYAVRLYLGTVQLQYDDNAAGAVAQYRQFLADGPPSTLVQQAAPEIRNAYQQAGLAVPGAVAG
jgi:cytochrome c-type biogenesis protein CcmH